MERNQQVILQIWKKNSVNKFIIHLQNSKGESLRNQDQIVEETLSFYRNLYESKDDKLNLEEFDQHLLRSDFSNLTEVKLRALEGRLSVGELLAALKKIPNNKSPGSDGFTAEFWKFFFNDVGIFLLRSLNYAYENGEVSITQRLGIITLLPKEDKPKQFLKNWSPITLLNITYKLASACIVERIKNILPDLINDDQKGFMEGRYTGENIRLLYDLIFYTKLRKQPGMLLLMDFEKVFHSVSHKFVFKALNFLNFGPSIMKWINLLYSNCMSSV